MGPLNRNNSAVDYTLICGVDDKHLHQLSYTWPTWKKHKPNLLNHPMIIFYDHEQVDAGKIQSVVDHPQLSLYPWPPIDLKYGDDSGEKWTKPQRVKMLTGFLYISADHVKTKYWLKLDTDVVAHSHPEWIDPEWFSTDPAIVCHPWGFTKPPKQMLELDAWVASNQHRDEFSTIAGTPPLNLHPVEGSERLRHPRIISWCGFFKASLSRLCVGLAEASELNYKMPIPSQDGYVWYVAKRMGIRIVRSQMKRRGWSQWLTQYNIETHAKEAMKSGQ